MFKDSVLLNRLKLATFKQKSMRIKQSKEYAINNWSGGTTTELYIFPEKSNYKALDFDFRLSTATVKDNYSLFTSLPTVSRKLLLLEGSFELKHENHHNALLSSGDVDTFEGDWKTESFGTGIDFNLMLRNLSEGELELIRLKANEKILLSNKVDMSYFYVYKGKGTVESDSYAEGDLFEITNKPIELLSATETWVVKASIKLKL